MLSHCRAYVVAKSGAQNRSLIRLCERAEFGFVGTALGEGAVRLEGGGSDVVFFLMHHLLADNAMKAILGSIRASEPDCLRYAPVILVINDSPYDTILRYIRFGFDDVIILPQKRELIVDRLRAQLNGVHVYFETPDYLGPDRRRFDLQGALSDPKRRLDTPHSRLHIHRSIEKGVRVVRREIVGRKATGTLLSRPQPTAGARVENRL